jgi:UDP-N-acetylmuramate dehydrogenase
LSLTSGFEHIVRENEPLAAHTSLKLGGAAQYFAEPTSADELVALVKRCADDQIPVRLLGGGSNLLVRSEGVEGCVILLSAPEFSQIKVEGNTMTAGGGAKLSHFIATAAREGFSGPEQLVGIPGTVGGALHNNTGHHGVDFGSWVQSAQVLTRDGQIATRDSDALSFSYRQSSLTELVILEGKFTFDTEPADELTRRMQKLWIVRRAAQPESDENSAYMFKDHGGESASKLIADVGLSGESVGAVHVSDRDPNFFVANPGATSAQVLELMDKVRQQVAERLEIELQDAIQIW